MPFLSDSVSGDGPSEWFFSLGKQRWFAADREVEDDRLMSKAYQLVKWRNCNAGPANRRRYENNVEEITYYYYYYYYYYY